MHTLKVWPLPVPPPPPQQIDVPQPTIRLGSTGTEVKELQMACKFWGWYPYTVDGSCGPRTVDAIKRMQAALKQVQDGVYGTKTAAAYLAFLKTLAAL